MTEQNDPTQADLDAAARNLVRALFRPENEDTQTEEND